MVNAIITSFETVGACQQVCEEKYPCYVAGGLGVLLTIVANEEENGHSKVRSVCDTIGGSVDQIMGALQDLTNGATEIGQEELSNLLRRICR